MPFACKQQALAAIYIQAGQSLSAAAAVVGYGFLFPDLLRQLINCFCEKFHEVII